MEYTYLHSDIINEILLRTSSDTLGRCRVVSKDWNQTIYDSKFKKLHSQKTDIADGFFVHDEWARHYTYFFSSIGDQTQKILLDFIPGYNVRIQAVSANNGIILCTSENFRRYRVPFFFVCKPRIKLYQQIPNPKTRFLAKGIAISVIRSNPFRYKILRISSPKQEFRKYYKNIILEVFDSEIWKWKRLKDIRLPYCIWFCCNSSVVTVCGAFHWLLYPNLIFSFDIENEEWKIIPFPVLEDDVKLNNLVEYEGKLALTCMDTEGYMHTWILKSYINLLWEKRFVVSMKVPGSTYLTYTPMIFYGSDIVVVTDFWSLIYYDFKKESILKMVKLKGHNDPRCIFPFWSNSEPCCLKPVREFQCSSKKSKKHKREMELTESSSIH